MASPDDGGRPDLRLESERQYWNDVEALFADALSAEGDARTRMLDERCAGRGRMRTDVESLLDAHARAGGFITPRTLDALEPDAAEDPGLSPVAGRRIGAFRALRRIAQGGMGEVYAGERVEGDFTQRVAIKLIAARLQGADVVRRFLAERQILATIQHPNVVSLLDGGVTGDGQPYIVMEYVDGVSIAEYCQEHALGLESRLRLFQQVCGAVAFAHRHLIVHRDLKPANVLVTGEGLVKVLDFGVAKLLEPQSAPVPATVALLGPLTPNYASPEQIRGLPVTTACDVYALGVMLYELMSGGRPYETNGLPVDEVVTLVLETQPARPSAAQGGLLPYERRRLRGDLDAIALKAMAKEPERRYASAEELGADVSRFLDGRPVEAREPSLAYLAGKTVSRYRTAFAVAVVFLVLLIAALVGAVWQARVAARERELAVKRFSDVRELARSLIFRIYDEVTPLPGSTAVRQTVIQEGLRFLERLEQDAAGDPVLQLELASAYLRIGDVQGLTASANLGNPDGALRAYRKAREYAVALAAASPPSWNLAYVTTGAHMRVANLLSGDEARAAARAGLASAAAWHAQEPDTVRARELLARAHFQVAAGETPSRRLEHWVASNKLFEAVLAEDPSNPNKIRNVALTEKQIGGHFSEEGDGDRALTHHRRAHDLDERTLRVKPDSRQAQIDLAIDIANIAWQYEEKRRYADALASYRRSLEMRERVSALDPADVFARSRVAFGYVQVGRIHLAMGDLAAAREYTGRALPIIEPLVGMVQNYRALWAFAIAQIAEMDWRENRRPAACRSYGRAAEALRLVREEELSRSDRVRRDEIRQRLAACGPP